MLRQLIHLNGRKLDRALAWLLDLAFLTVITSKLNESNLELQGKDRNISSMTRIVNTFQKKLKLWIAHLIYLNYNF
jgi:hypothetical protein